MRCCLRTLSLCYVQIHDEIPAFGTRQELVAKKMELAQLHEEHELICHEFLKADVKHGAVLLKIKRRSRQGMNGQW